MITKYLNYKDLLYDENIIPIENKKYTLFNKDDFFYPYLETYLISNIDNINLLNKKGRINIDSTFDFDITIYDDFIILEKKEVICYFEIKQREVISHYCHPKYQRFGYLRLLFDWIINEYHSVKLSLNFDNIKFKDNLLFRNSNGHSTGLLHKELDYIYIMNSESRIQKNKFMDSLDKNINFCRYGINSYTESYRWWNP